MKKKAFWCLALLTMISTHAFAATGYAYDALAFILVLVGILMMIAGILWGIDYLGKNWRTLKTGVTAYLKKKVSKRNHPMPNDTDHLPFSV
jgi:hypothetical protein